MPRISVSLISGPQAPSHCMPLAPWRRHLAYCCMRRTWFSFRSIEVYDEATDVVFCGAEAVRGRKMGAKVAGGTTRQ